MAAITCIGYALNFRYVGFRSGKYMYLPSLPPSFEEAQVMLPAEAKAERKSILVLSHNVW